jgi:beta-glucanase (GH16 family)
VLTELAQGFDQGGLGERTMTQRLQTEGPRCPSGHARWVSAALVAMLAVAAATATTQAATPRRSGSAHHCGMAAITEGVAAPGTYRVAVTITTRGRSRQTVDLLIGPVLRRVTPGPRAQVILTLPITGRTLTVLVTTRCLTPRLRVSLRELRAVSASASPTPAPGTTTAQAPTAHAAPAPPVATTPAPPAQATLTFPGSPVATTPAQGPIGDPGSWHLVFDDEFSGSTLNAGDWSTGWLGAGRITAPVNAEELECYDPKHVVVTGGELQINLTETPEFCGQSRPYTSGMITTDGKFSFTYGFIEARVWLPSSSVINDWPAIWADGQSWPQDGELDVVEGLGGQACWHFHNSAGAPGGCETASFAGGWHTFGADWEPGTVTWYYDGIPVGTVSSGITSDPMFLAIDLAADTIYGGPVTPGTLEVDYMRVWQH